MSLLVQKLNEELVSWKKTAQEENDRALELEVRLELAEARLAAAQIVVEAARAEHDEGEEQDYFAECAVYKAITAYDAAVPARGEARAPEGGSTPPAAIDGLCDECGGQFSDLAGHKALGAQTHPWLDKRSDLNSVEREDK